MSSRHDATRKVLVRRFQNDLRSIRLLEDETKGGAGQIAQVKSWGLILHPLDVAQFLEDIQVKEDLGGWTAR